MTGTGTGAVFNPKLKEFIASCAQENSWTKDIGYLTRQYKTVPVFVYGTMKQNFSDHAELDSLLRIGIGYTMRHHFVMYKNSFAGLVEPVALQLDLQDQKGKIKGEVYLVPIKKLLEIDGFHSNELFFQRKMEYVDYYDPNSLAKDAVICRSEMYMYVGIPSTFVTARSKGQFLRDVRYLSSQGSYYEFSRVDDAHNKVRQREIAEKSRQRTSNTSGVPSTGDRRCM